jgi:predicted nucleic acid-binding protein
LSEVLYVDTSAVLRAVLERGLTPAVERRIGEARFLITSRLSLVETARAFARLRHDGVPETALADAAREADSIWARCAVWELTPATCDVAATVAPRPPLRSLDALHLATFLLARRSFGDEVDLVTTDARLQEALRSV